MAMLASQAGAQGPLRRILFGPLNRGCANGQCEVAPSAPKPAEPIVAAEPAPLAMRSLAPKTFAGALQSQLAKKESLSFGERRLMRILNSPDSPQRDRQIARMERHVRAHLDLSPAAAIDWNAEIDWGTLLSQILQLLLALLPLFI